MPGLPPSLFSGMDDKGMEMDKAITLDDTAKMIREPAHDEDETSMAARLHLALVLTDWETIAKETIKTGTMVSVGMKELTATDQLAYLLCKVYRPDLLGAPND